MMTGIEKHWNIKFKPGEVVVIKWKDGQETAVKIENVDAYSMHGEMQVMYYVMECVSGIKYPVMQELLRQMRSKDGEGVKECKYLGTCDYWGIQYRPNEIVSHQKLNEHGAESVDVRIESVCAKDGDFGCNVQYHVREIESRIGYCAGQGTLNRKRRMNVKA